MGVCEGALAVVSGPSDRIWLAFEIVLVAWVRPKGQERSCRLTPPGLSRYDPSILQPLPVYKHTQSASVYLIRDAESRNCRCIQSSTFRPPTPQGAQRHADICG